MIVRWKAKEHYRVIASWYHARELEAPLAEMLPEVGYVVDKKVAGWVTLTDSNMAVIDTFISNPHTTPSSRAHAIEKLTGVLIDSAMALGYTKIICLTNVPTLKKEAFKYGLKETDQVVFMVDESQATDDDSEESM